MKKVFFLMFGVMLTLGVAAQDNGMWLGGTVGFDSGEAGGVETSSYQFGPSWGMMLTEDMGVGVTLTLSGSEEGNNKSNGWEFAPYFRKYFNIVDNLKFYGDAGFIIGGGEQGTDNDYSTFSIGARPGLQYWFSNQWSLASSLGYIGYESGTYNKDTPAEYDESSFGLKVDMSTVNFSLFFHF